jgi:hypothetical protein
MLKRKPLQMRYLTLILVLLIGGCATSSRTYLPDGSQGHSITCSGSALNWGMCYEKAGQLCGSGGYNIIERSGDSNSMISGNQYGIYGGSVQSRNLLVHCKNPDANTAKLPNEPQSQPPAPESSGEKKWAGDKNF